MDDPTTVGDVEANNEEAKILTDVAKFLISEELLTKRKAIKHFLVMNNHYQSQGKTERNSNTTKNRKDRKRHAFTCTLNESLTKRKAIKLTPLPTNPYHPHCMSTNQSNHSNSRHCSDSQNGTENKIAVVHIKKDSEQGLQSCVGRQKAVAEEDENINHGQEKNMCDDFLQEIMRNKVMRMLNVVYESRR